jgi:hypothetical protein
MWLQPHDDISALFLLVPRPLLVSWIWVARLRARNRVRCRTGSAEAAHKLCETHMQGIGKRAAQIPFRALLCTFAFFFRSCGSLMLFPRGVHPFLKHRFTEYAVTLLYSMPRALPVLFGAAFWLPILQPEQIRLMADTFGDLRA